MRVIRIIDKEFRKGDKVRIISAIPPSHNGETATFDRFNNKGRDSGYNVILDGGELWFCGEIESAVDEREQAIYKRLSKVKRPKPKVLKVGDKVRLLVTKY